MSHTSNTTGGTVTGTDTDSSTKAAPRVLFVCVRNGGKSQMAAGLMRHAADQHGLRVQVTSAGTRAGEKLNAQSVTSLAEVGVDISGARTHQLTEADVRAADLVVVLGSEASVEPVGNTPVEVWETDEPSSRGIEGMERMRLVRDDISRRVAELVSRLEQTRSGQRAGGLQEDVGGHEDQEHSEGQAGGSR